MKLEEIYQLLKEAESANTDRRAEICRKFQIDLPNGSGSPSGVIETLIRRLFGATAKQRSHRLGELLPFLWLLCGNRHTGPGSTIPELAWDEVDRITGRDPQL